ncbi:hypothetical protein LKL81_24265 [Bacillus paranthracis]|uniref:hypothetical protein n=1 Tax=Bacillus cereus group TaxID=86661 RepID=UPI00027A33DD|nr:hypothetical protein [Bacillus paranthracis]EJR17889.1 hypothetical protein II9_02091 [Bacillus cereus MSX-D12]KMP40161.1 hypothetical protein TU55_24250 [Bacillus cereus]KMP67174.1 hypothetical protein TU61_12960 [Bacillus cereus]MCC2374076.1 hypothetical protein [Bacillus paranthracis]MCC2430334.1 hypothetical protein [Bacillus paranthracis]
MLIAGFEEKAKAYLESVGCKLVKIGCDHNMLIGHSIFYIDRDGESATCGEYHIIKHLMKPKEDDIKCREISIMWLKRDKKIVSFDETKVLIQNEIDKKEEQMQILEEGLAVWRHRIAELEAR